MVRAVRSGEICAKTCELGDLGDHYSTNPEISFTVLGSIAGCGFQNPERTLGDRASCWIKL